LPKLLEKARATSDSSVEAASSKDYQQKQHSDMPGATVKHTFIHVDNRNHVDHYQCFSVPRGSFRNYAETRDFAPSYQKGPQTAVQELNNHPPSNPTNKRKKRPTKKKRDQYHKLVNAVIGEMETNPNGFDIESLQQRVPASMCDNERLLRKFMGKMKMIHARLKAQQESCHTSHVEETRQELPSVSCADALAFQQCLQEESKLQDDVCKVVANSKETRTAWEVLTSHSEDEAEDGAGSMEELHKLEGGKLQDMCEGPGAAIEDGRSWAEQAVVRVRNTFIEIWVPEAPPRLRARSVPPLRSPGSPTGGTASSLAETLPPYRQKPSAATTPLQPAAKADAEAAPWVLRCELSERLDSLLAADASKALLGEEVDGASSTDGSTAATAELESNPGQ